MQSGTLCDSAASNPNGYWIPSVAMSRQGHVALSSSRAGNTNFAGIGAAGRLRSDALGSTQTPLVVQTGAGPYNVGTGTPEAVG